MSSALVVGECMFVANFSGSSSRKILAATTLSEETLPVSSSTSNGEGFASLSISALRDHTSQSLAIPTAEQSLSGSSNEEKQSRKVVDLSAQAIPETCNENVVKPHLEEFEDTKVDTAIEENSEVVSGSHQNTWGPSHQPSQSPTLQRSKSCPHLQSLFDHQQPLQKSYPVQAHTDKDQYVVNELPPASKYLLKKQLESIEDCITENGKFSVEEESSYEYKAEAGVESAKISQEECHDVHAPVECTNACAWNHGTKSKPVPNIQYYGKFGDINSYGKRGSFVCIHSTTQEIYDMDFRKLEWVNAGGNSSVYSCSGFAAKETKYNPENLDIVSKFNHPNIMELLGVVLLDLLASEVCFHVIPLMSYDLHKVLSKCDVIPLKESARTSNVETWDVILSNVMYILKKLLMALDYLEKQNIQHGDVKEKNILIKKYCCCQCILLCECPERTKYSVKLADFDYISKTESYCEPPDVLCLKDSYRVEYHGGTFTYRGPEEFLRSKSCHFRLNGTYGDIWNVGILLQNMCLGRSTPTEHCKANIVAGLSCSAKLKMDSEINLARERLIVLLLDATKCRRLKYLSQLTEACLKIIPNDRKTANFLLSLIMNTRS